MQLVKSGEKDIILNGNPSKSFFKAAYSKYTNFSFADIADYYEMWKRFDSNNPNGLTNRSIMYWAKTDNYQEYQNIRKETITYFIEQTLDKHTEFDLANVLYQIYKDQFVCVSIKNNIWYEYSNYKWNEIDSGSTLRLLISKTGLTIA